MKKFGSLNPKYLIALAVLFFTFSSVQVEAITFGEPETDIHSEKTISDAIMFHAGTKDRTGNLWWGTAGSVVYRYDFKSGTFYNFTKVDGLIDNSVSSIYEDKAGNMWFGTAYGVCRYNANPPDGPGKSFTNITTKEGPCQYDVSCILEDRNGIFWFGTTGYGVCRYDPAMKSFTNFTKEDGLTSNGIQCMFEDKKGTIWFGPRAGSVCYYDPEKKKTGGQSFSRFAMGDCINSQVMGILEDNTGNIWFCDLYLGLCRYNPTSGKCTRFTSENGLRCDTSTCIYLDKTGNLWIGNDRGKSERGNGGACRYDPSSAWKDSLSYTSFSTENGLCNLDVWGFIEDNAGNIWIGSRGGLCRYDARQPDGQGISFVDFSDKIDK
ncbi:hypothetical protein BH11BAC1_BH11BAC1_00150 [soil metagenome]